MQTNPAAAALLKQARRRLVSAPARAEKHRAIYLAVWPLVFADKMEVQL
jgi:hypothetical protein